MGLPYYAVVLAVTEGDRISDVRLGYVQNLVTGDEYHAVAGAGAFHNGEPLRPTPPPFDGRSISLVQLDAPSGAEPRERAAPVFARAEKVRQLGSAALNLCHTASILILREAGGIATDYEGASIDSVSVRLDARTTLLASLSQEIHAYALELLRVRVP